MKKKHRLYWILMGLFLLTGSACTLTPHANIGLDVDYYNGGFHVRPNANLGVYGRP